MSYVNILHISVGRKIFTSHFRLGTIVSHFGYVVITATLKVISAATKVILATNNLMSAPKK